MNCFLVLTGPSIKRPTPNTGYLNVTRYPIPKRMPGMAMGIVAKKSERALRR